MVHKTGRSGTCPPFKTYLFAENTTTHLSDSVWLAGESAVSGTSEYERETREHKRVQILFGCLAVLHSWLLMFGDVERFGFDYNTCGTGATGCTKAKRGWISKN